MELSPEERRRIYEEEKVRLQAQEDIRREAAAAHKAEVAPKSKTKPLGCLNWLIIILALFYLLGIFASNANNAKHPKTASTPTPSRSNPAMLAQCEDLIQSGYQTGVLTEVTFESNYTRVVVGPAFYAIDFDAKQGFCRAIGYVGESRGARKDFMIRDSRTNKRVGSFVTGMLKLD